VRTHRPDPERTEHDLCTFPTEEAINLCPRGNRLAAVDEHLARLLHCDATTAGDDPTVEPPVTMNEVVGRWRCFTAAVTAIDQAMSDPMAPMALAILLGSRRLAERAHELLQTIGYIGEAVASEGDGFRLEVLRDYGVPLPASSVPPPRNR
jgi:hypothetical protein